MINIDQISKLLPQKPPFLMVDRIVEVEAGKRIVAIKNVTINDPILNAHFPEQSVMPGALIIESMAQTAILLHYSTKEFKFDPSLKFFLGSVKAHFSGPVVPGDQLRLEANLVKALSNGLYVEVKALVGNKEVSKSELVCIVQK
jgi:3-hydroxyacyl-[acyl-carrier-protein] dehydratase